MIKKNIKRFFETGGTDLYSKYIKRFLGISLSFIAIIICIPIYGILALLVRIKLGKPILFKQLRISKNNKKFKIYKFRTMTDARDENGNLLSTELRLTKFGILLRSTALDELPELFNILKGDISFVGPRPLLVEYLPLYTKYEMQRHNVRGGLIPPEVLYGDVTPTWEQQFEYEVYYVNNISFLIDFKIILATFKCIVKRTSINYGNHKRDPFVEDRMNKMKQES